jgi:hypothetical protein
MLREMQLSSIGPSMQPFVVDSPTALHAMTAPATSWGSCQQGLKSASLMNKGM